MESFADVIAKWPSTAEFGNDIGIVDSLTAVWKHRKSIPVEYWRKIVEKAAERGIDGVSLELLASLAEKRSDARAAHAVAAE